MPRNASFDKAFLLTMDDGNEVIAKIPCPNARPPSLTTASEVATLKFLRLYTSICVPEVLAWSSSATNPVGAEYIIMEKIQGVPLTGRWDTMNTLERYKMIDRIVEMEKELVGLQFPASGSLFLREYVPSGYPHYALPRALDPAELFYIGPSLTLVFLCLSFIAVALRCFVRLRLVKAFGWDDGLMVLAMVFNIWFAICGLAGSIAGIGKRFDQFDSVEDAHTALLHEQWWWLGQSAYVWVVATARISIAMLLLRLTVQRRESVVMYSVIGLTATVGLAFWLILTLQCDPVREFWQRTGRGHCIDTQYVLDIAYLYSATACLCDFTLGLFPVYLLRNLQLSWRTKWAIRVILSMGCIAGAAVAARIPYLPDYQNPDFLYATTGIAISSNIEAGLGITAGSLITLRPLMRWLRDSSSVEQKHTSPGHGRPDIEAAMLSTPSQAEEPQSQVEEPQFAAGAM
ncbi:hypothetical protein CNMCM5878_010474 [Aspergillus fumigatiaffinis]|nr:hypothetical protein CNMCM5878_010474 [Aspergillus fumigatiaffinis]